jgi:hypothetical protein
MQVANKQMLFLRKSAKYKYHSYVSLLHLDAILL